MTGVNNIDAALAEEVARVHAEDTERVLQQQEEMEANG